MNTYISVKVGSSLHRDIVVFHFINIFMYSCGDLHAQLHCTPLSCWHFKFMIMAILVEPDLRSLDQEKPLHEKT